MVGLTVFTPSPQPMDFRNAVLWDRAIPPCTLSLNGRGTYPRTWPNIPPIPMFWCHFGGPGGQYLKDLVGIAAVYHGHSFFQLAFSFENDDVPEEFRFLGGTRSVGNRSMITFDIDGPGGERIETVRITHEAPGEVTMSMVTGRPRILCFQVRHSLLPLLLSVLQPTSQHRHGATNLVVSDPNQSRKITQCLPRPPSMGRCPCGPRKSFPWHRDHGVLRSSGTSDL